MYINFDDYECIQTGYSTMSDSAIRFPTREHNSSTGITGVLVTPNMQVCMTVAFGDANIMLDFANVQVVIRFDTEKNRDNFIPILENHLTYTQADYPEVFV